MDYLLLLSPESSNVSVFAETLNNTNAVYANLLNLVVDVLIPIIVLLSIIRMLFSAFKIGIGEFSFNTDIQDEEKTESKKEENELITNIEEKIKIKVAREKPKKFFIKDGKIVVKKKKNEELL